MPINDEQFLQLMAAVNRKNNGVPMKIAAALMVALIIGSWTILYTRIESIAAVQQSRGGTGDRVTSLEVILESYQKTIDQRLTTMQRQLDEIQRDVKKR